jgi:hypothetical protein
MSEGVVQLGDAQHGDAKHGHSRHAGSEYFGSKLGNTEHGSTTHSDAQARLRCGKAVRHSFDCAECACHTNALSTAPPITNLVRLRLSGRAWGE